MFAPQSAIALQMLLGLRYHLVTCSPMRQPKEKVNIEIGIQKQSGVLIPNRDHVKSVAVIKLQPLTHLLKIEKVKQH